MIGWVVETIIRSVINAIITAVVVAVTVAVSRAVAGAVTNSLESKMKNSVIGKLAEMTEDEKKEWIKQRIDVQVQKVSFGKYELYFEEHIFGMYSANFVAHKDEIIKQLSKDMNNFVEDTLNKIARDNEMISDLKKNKEELIELEDAINVYHTMSFGLVDQTPPSRIDVLDYVAKNKNKTVHDKLFKKS